MTNHIEGIVRKVTFKAYPLRAKPENKNVKFAKFLAFYLGKKREKVEPLSGVELTFI